MDGTASTFNEDAALSTGLGWFGGCGGQIDVQRLMVFGQYFLDSAVQMYVRSMLCSWFVVEVSILCSECPS